MENRSYQANESRIGAIKEVATFAGKLLRMAEAGVVYSLDQLISGKGKLTCLYAVFSR
jgi:hypothetical protein